jgi:hypothetical protein
MDYENDREMGEVESARPRLAVRFTGHLLLEASREAKRPTP